MLWNSLVMYQFFPPNFSPIALVEFEARFSGCDCRDHRDGFLFLLFVCFLLIQGETRKEGKPIFMLFQVDLHFQLNADKYKDIYISISKIETKHGYHIGNTNTQSINEMCLPPTPFIQLSPSLPSSLFLCSFF